MNIPQDLKYAPTHEWLRQEADGSCAVGISDHAQQALGDIVFLELPEIGRPVKAGEACAVVESVKAASDIYAPIDGEVVARNEALLDTPEQVNSAPYESWLFKVSPAGTASLAGLLDAEAYAKVAAEA